MATKALRALDVGGPAGDEAAREARIEARSEQSDPKTPSKPGKDGWHRFDIDVWITNLNSVEFGIYKRSRNKAKSRQFSTDMDIFAEIIENGQRSGLLGYRKDLWTDKSGMDKRLVFKLFTAGLGWRATMDMMIGKSLQQTLGARGLPITAFSINTDDDDFIIYLERSGNKWPLLPENFAFFLMNDHGPEFYRLRRAVINLGGDYTLLNQKNEVVGWLDGKVLTLGGYWKGAVKVGDADKRLLAVMKLFAGMILFNGQARRHVRELYHDVLAGKVKPVIDRQEGDLYMNPRRVR